MRVGMTASLQLKKRARMMMKIKMTMMSVTWRRNQAERKEGRRPSGWVVNSFNNISSLMRDILFILKTKVTKGSPRSSEEIGRAGCSEKGVSKYN